MTTAISVDRLSKTFLAGFRKPVVTAIQDVTFSVSEGEAFGFVGPNGAGKSTTIKILTGIQRSTLGTAEIFGVSVTEANSRARVGYVPENPYLFEYLTPMEILRLGLRQHRIQIKNESSHCEEWLVRLQLDQVAHKPIRSFSKGMVQRVAIAQAMCINPRLLILDEPLSGLDPIGRRDVVDLLAEYKRGGGTLFFTSHVLHDVERLADRFGLIHRGQLRAVRSPSELVGESDKLLVRSIGARAVPGMRDDFGGRWSGEVEQSELWVHLENLRAAGHTLVEVKPTLSLESVFMRVVAEK